MTRPFGPYPAIRATINAKNLPDQLLMLRCKAEAKRRGISTQRFFMEQAARYFFDQDREVGS